MCRLIQFPHLPYSEVCWLESPGASVKAVEMKATRSCLPGPVAACTFLDSIRTPASRLWLLVKLQTCSHVQPEFQIPLWRSQVKWNKNSSRAPANGP